MKKNTVGNSSQEHVNSSSEEDDVIFKIRAGSLLIVCGCILMLATVILGTQSILRYGLLWWQAGYGLLALIGVAIVILGKRFNNRSLAQPSDFGRLDSLRDPTQCEVPADNQNVTDGPPAESEIPSIATKVKDTSDALGSRNYVTPHTRH